MAIENGGHNPKDTKDGERCAKCNTRWPCSTVAAWRHGAALARAANLGRR